MGYSIKQQAQLVPERRERTAGQQDRSGVEFQVAAAQLKRDPRVGRRRADRLVVRQRPGRAVDQEQLKLGAYRGGASSESRPFEQLPECEQAVLEPLPEARIIALIELSLSMPVPMAGPPSSSYGSPGRG